MVFLLQKDLHPRERQLPEATFFWGPKKTYKQKTHKHFSDGPCGTIVPGTNPHPSQGQTGQNGDFTVELNRKRPFCPRDRSQFVPGRGPVCPRAGSCLSRTLSLPKCLCLLVFFLPDFFVFFRPFFTALHCDSSRHLQGARAGKCSPEVPF